MASTLSPAAATTAGATAMLQQGEPPSKARKLNLRKVGTNPSWSGKYQGRRVQSPTVYSLVIRPDSSPLRGIESRARTKSFDKNSTAPAPAAAAAAATSAGATATLQQDVFFETSQKMLQQEQEVPRQQQQKARACGLGIVPFLEGKHVLITGATGFIGKGAAFCGNGVVHWGALGCIGMHWGALGCIGVHWGDWGALGCIGPGVGQLYLPFEASQNSPHVFPSSPPTFPPGSVGGEDPARAAGGGAAVFAHPTHGPRHCSAAPQATGALLAVPSGCIAATALLFPQPVFSHPYVHSTRHARTRTPLPHSTSAPPLITPLPHSTSSPPPSSVCSSSFPPPSPLLLSSSSFPPQPSRCSPPPPRPHNLSPFPRPVSRICGGSTQHIISACIPSPQSTQKHNIPLSLRLHPLAPGRPVARILAAAGAAWGGIRGGHGSQAHARARQLLRRLKSIFHPSPCIPSPQVLPSPVFSLLRERHGEGYEAFMAGKLTAVQGNVGEDGLGLAAHAAAALEESVDLIFNFAATVDFEAPYVVLTRPVRCTARGPYVPCTVHCTWSLRNVGDDGLGLAAHAAAALEGSVDLIFNFAATVDFEAPYVHCLCLCLCLCLCIPSKGSSFQGCC
ncbi:unnamed protein product [Closterium sp. NIES-54]